MRSIQIDQKQRREKRSTNCMMIWWLAIVACVAYCASGRKEATEDAYYFYELGKTAQYEFSDGIAALQHYAHADKLVSTGVSSMDKDVYVNMLNDFGVLLFRHVGASSMAVSTFESALRINPSHLSALVNLAGVYDSMHDTAMAEKNFQLALHFHPTSAALHYNYGVHKYRLNDKTSAESEWLTALQYEDLHLAAANVATLYCNNNDMSTAAQYYNRASSSARSSSDNFSILFQQYTGVLPILLNSHEHIKQVRETFLRNLIFLHLILPHNSISAPYDHLGCSSLGYYAIYHGYNDMLLRRLYSNVLRIASSTYLNSNGHHTATSATSKLRVGFLGGFFYHHSVGLLMQGVIANIDRSKFDVSLILFDDMPTQDHVTQYILSSVDKSIVLNEDINTSRHQIRALGLDVLIFTEIGMHSQTYFLAHSCLAANTAVFWGHAVTSGITNRDGCAPDYFISSVLFENSAAAQCKYTERLLLLQGLTTYFLPPDPPLSIDEINSNAKHITRSGDGSGSSISSSKSWSVRVLPSKVQFLRYLFDCSNSSGSGSNRSSSSSKVCSEELSEERRLYGIPQTLYKLSPQFVAVVKKVLQNDMEGWLLMPAGQDGKITMAAIANLATVLGDDAMTRVIFVRAMNGREFITLISFFDVVLDTFPVGGGRSSLEIFSVGTPIVVLPQATAILQLTAGMYRVMGINCCIATSEDDYVSLTVTIANNATMQRSIRSDILFAKSRLYSNISVIEEWEHMLTYISTRKTQPHNAVGHADVNSSYCHEHRSEYAAYIDASDFNETAIALNAIHATKPVSETRIDEILPLFSIPHDLPAITLLTPASMYREEWRKLRQLWTHVGKGKNSVIYEASYVEVLEGSTLPIVIRNIDTLWQQQLYQQLLPVKDRLKLHYIAAVASIGINSITQPVISRLPVAFHLSDDNHNEVVHYNINIHRYETIGQVLMRLITDDALRHVPYNGIYQLDEILLNIGDNTESSAEAVAYRQMQSVKWMHWMNNVKNELQITMHRRDATSPISDTRITIGITTSRRLNHFRRTAAALLRVIREMRSIGILHEVLVIDDFSSDSDRSTMLAEFGDDFTFIMKPVTSRGHANSLNVLMQHITTKYFVYLEDDWLLLDNPLVSPSLSSIVKSASTHIFLPLLLAARDILSLSELTSEPVHQILFNEQAQRLCSLGEIEECDAEQLTSGGWSRSIANISYQLHEFALLHQVNGGRNHEFATWPGFSLNPGIWNMHALFDMLGSNNVFSEFDTAFEQRSSLELHAVGWTMGYLPAVVLQHIGDVSSYALNNVSRPFDT